MTSHRLRSLGFWSLVVAILAYMTLPTLVVLMTSVNPTEILAFPPEGISFQWYEKALTYPDFQRAFKNGLIVTSLASTAALIVGSTFAWLVHRYTFRGRGLLEAVLWSPLIIPHFTLGFGFLLLGGAFGLQQGYVMIVLAHMVLVMPFVTRAVYVSLANIDPDLTRAAANLGASPFHVLTRIEPAAGAAGHGGRLADRRRAVADRVHRLALCDRQPDPDPAGRHVQLHPRICRPDRVGDLGAADHRHHAHHVHRRPGLRPAPRTGDRHALTLPEGRRS
ncbi:ABC transporter permease [Ancylobacter dichloromethanicus]